jgi:hypothetical protein
MAEAGYRAHSSADDPEYLAQSGQLAFRHPENGFGVDLHWKLASFGVPMPFSEEEMWAGLQELPVAGSLIPTLRWEDLALFLAFHGTKERWRSLKWICDFSALSRTRPELDWEDLQRRAARNHCARHLLLGARLCEALGLDAPAPLLAAAQWDASVESLVERTLRQLLNPVPETDISIFSYELAATERCQDKAVLLFRLITTLTVSDFRTVRLPRRLRSLYYAIRPFRLAGKALGLLARNYRLRAAR